MILTDDDFSTIVRAVRIGRGLYDNLKKYIQFQMAALMGFITMFLGASIFDIANGVPLVPLQTLWVNFTTQVFMAVGLGYGEPASDLMQRKPRPENEPILPRGLLAYLVICGLVLGGTSLGIIWWAEDAHDVSVARTMGLTTFAIANVFLAYTVKDRLRSIFSEETFADRRLLLATGLSAVAILFESGLPIFQRILGTVSLTGQQWVACILAASSIVVVSEVRKFFLRRQEGVPAPSSAPVPEPT